MSVMITYVAPPKFSSNDIDQQLKRIFLHPDFTNSEILKKFLSFVVSETLIGNACLLKEYTIALKVLEKPVNFNPQRNCIVRIHARRLRCALSHYYNNLFIEDEIIIDMPKGKYVPVFMHRHEWLEEMKNGRSIYATGMMRLEKEPITFAILPFICDAGGDPIRSFSENLCLNICSALSQVNHISVIGFQAIKGMAGPEADIKELSALLRFNHFISGGIQYLKHRIRVNLQIVDCRSYQQVWTKIVECRITDSNLFEVQDEICQVITNQANELTILNNQSV
jgi:TolB-like protein